jgi:hypothetical protein
MAFPILKNRSQRNGIEFNKLPDSYRYDYGTAESIRTYGAILDCTYEMTRDVGDANGIPYSVALATVLVDEGYTVLPTHRKLILERLEAGL